jgi:hypothetical protein
MINETKKNMTTKSLLQKFLQGILQTEDESKQNHNRTGSIKTQKKRHMIRKQH